MPRRKPLPESLRDRPFLVREGMQEGLGPTRLRQRDLQRPFRGVRALSAETLSLREMCGALALHLRQASAFSHVTAAELYAVPLPWRLRFRPGQSVHVTVPHPRRPPQMKGVVGHQLRELAIARALGLPVTSVEQTWHDLASCLTRQELVTAGDFLISGRAPLTTTESLRAHLTARPGRRGSALARECLELIRPGVESPKESVLRLVIVDAGLPEPVVNHVIRSPSGRFIARVDLAYPAERIAIEYEGDIHRTDLDQFRKDITRRERVEDLWDRMIRVTHDDLDDPELVDRIRRSLLRARKVT